MTFVTLYLLLIIILTYQKIKRRNSMPLTSKQQNISSKIDNILPILTTFSNHPSNVETGCFDIYNYSYNNTKEKIIKHLKSYDSKIVIIIKPLNDNILEITIYASCHINLRIDFEWLRDINDKLCETSKINYKWPHTWHQLANKDILFELSSSSIDQIKNYFNNNSKQCPPLLKNAMIDPEFGFNCDYEFIYDIHNVFNQNYQVLLF